MTPAMPHAHAPSTVGAPAGSHLASHRLGRRQLLVAAGGAMAAVVAGCSSTPTATQTETTPVTTSVTPQTEPATTQVPSTTQAPATPTTAPTTAPATLPPNPRPSTNPYLAGNFAPVRDELDATTLTVRGALPPELNGLLLRNGPNPIAADPATYHWFLGDGMVHGIELAEGRATSYRNRWMRTPASSPLLGEPTPAGPAGANPTPLLANTSIVEHGGRLLALVETNLPTEFSRDLSTVGTFDFAGALRSPMTAHPKIDPATGEMWFIGNDLFGPPYLRLHVVDAAGALVRTQDIEIPRPSMIHDFAMTATQVVILDLPVVYDLGLLGVRPFPAAWDATAGARVGVVPRDGSAAPTWIEIDPCYVFHTANAHDDGSGRVIVDVCRYERMFENDPYGVADAAPRFERWTIDPVRGTVDRAVVDERGQEFPRIDPRLLGRPYRFAYTAAFAPAADGGVGLGGLFQHDLTGGRTPRSISASAGRQESRCSSRPPTVPANRRGTCCRSCTTQHGTPAT